jgi:hypothetical protein
MDLFLALMLTAIFSFIVGYVMCLQGFKQMIRDGELVKREDVKRIVRLRERL